MSQPSQPVPGPPFPPPQLWGPPLRLRPVARRRAQAVVVPLLAVVLGAVGTLIGMLGVLERPPLVSVLSVTVFTVVALLGVWFLNWLDRWEPEPPIFTIGAFLWGAGVSALISGVVNTVFLAATGDLSLTAMYSAPFIEESTKALFIVLMIATRRGRAEFNSLTDAIVYGGMVGLGFSWIENISYALQPEAVADSLQVIVIRLLLVAFLHPMLTIVVSIGIWLGINSRGVARLAYPFVFWCLAVGLHFLHNASTELFGDTGYLVTAGLEVVVFTGLVVVGVSARGAERATLREELPVMVHQGWLTPYEAGWLADLSARKRVLAAAGPSKATLTQFLQNVTELALLRGRLGRDRTGRPPTEWLQLHRELVGVIIAQRPDVDRALGTAPSWRPVLGHHGDAFQTSPYR